MKKSSILLFCIKTLLIAAMPASVAGVSSCQSNKENKSTQETIQDRFKDAPEFNADSAYSFLEKQVSFGPRVPGTPEHDLCGQYLINEMKRLGADTVITQEATVTAYTGDRLPITNIISRYDPDNKNRVLLLAHWDTRPWADADTHTENHTLPIPGANDGASGVAALMEIGRHINEMDLPVGVDLLFVDAEDYGRSGGFTPNEETWCLGTQYWAEHLPYTAEDMPRYGICLDMVGGTGAVFHREFVSDMKAKDVVDKVWNVALLSGYEDRFINSSGGSLIDDHVFVNRAGIPCIDIVELNSNATRSFPASWHTMGDNLDNIDRGSLKAAGQTVLNTLFLEKQAD